MNPAFRFGGRQGEELRAGGDVKISAADQATAVRDPTNLPSWDHIAQICELYGREGGHRPLAVAEADYADAYNQLPLKG